MHVSIRRFAFAAAAGGLLAVGQAGSTQAAQHVVTAVGLQQYASPQVAIVEGDSLTFVNGSPLNHDVVHRVAAGQKRLFASALIGIGRTAEVTGVPALPPGSYPFTCTLHGNMKGTLTVVDDAVIPPTPTPPPAPGVSAVAVGGTVPTPTSLTYFDGAMYVASYGQGSVMRLDVLDGGLLGAPTTYASGFRAPLGIAFAPDGTLFVADSHPSSRADRNTAGRVWAIAPGGGDTAATGSVVIDELPNGRHNTNGMHVRDGRLYIANGNSTDDGVNGGDPEEPLSGTLLSVDVNVRGITPADTASYVVEATGMRNIYDVAFRPGTDEAWLPVNGPDEFDPDGEDTLHVASVSADAPHFGFPECIYGRNADGSAKAVDNPSIATPCGAHTPPEQLLGLHVSANGLAFGPDDSTWGGDLFIAEFGNFFGNEVKGHRVVRVPIEADGTSGPPQDFFFGAAPLDLTFGPPGTGLYVADFATGQITLLRPIA